MDPDGAKNLDDCCKAVTIDAIDSLKNDEIYDQFTPKCSGDSDIPPVSRGVYACICKPLAMWRIDCHSPIFYLPILSLFVIYSIGAYLIISCMNCRLSIRRDSLLPTYLGSTDI